MVDVEKLLVGEFLIQIIILLVFYFASLYLSWQVDFATHI